jgi:hypothetical protein
MTGLFANQRQINLNSTIQLIEQALRGLGHDPGACRLAPRGDDEALWQFEHGSARTCIQLSKGDASFLRVSSTVMTLDEGVDRLALYGHLLGLNRGLRGLTLAVDEDQVELAAERPSRDLDRSEIDDQIGRAHV